MGHPSVALANGIGYCVPCTPQQFVQTAQTTDDPKPITDVQTYFRKATVLAKNALDGTNNTGTIYIGPSSAASEQPYILEPGDEIVLEPPLGAKWNFQDWYLVVATNDDGVVIIYS